MTGMGGPNNDPQSDKRVFGGGLGCADRHGPGVPGPAVASAGAPVSFPTYVQPVFYRSRPAAGAFDGRGAGPLANPPMPPVFSRWLRSCPQIHPARDWWGLGGRMKASTCRRGTFRPARCWRQGLFADGNRSTIRPIIPIAVMMCPALKAGTARGIRCAKYAGSFLRGFSLDISADRGIMMNAQSSGRVLTQGTPCRRNSKWTNCGGECSCTLVLLRFLPLWRL